jgi:hypothetical protein
MAKIEERFFSIDSGNLVSGVAVTTREQVIYAGNIPNEEVIPKITEFSENANIIVLIEDIRPYAMKLTPQVIETCKVIGELMYRIKFELGLDYVLITRAEVKKWVFDRFEELSSGRISKRIEYMTDYREKRGERGYRKKDGSLRSPSFHFVDDRVVIAAMKEYWDIPTPKPGKSNKFGLSKHSWQALAVGTTYLSKLSNPS